MKKDGFIFIETIIATVVIIISLTVVFATFSLVSNRNEINKYYNRPNEIYALYYFMKLGPSKNETFYNNNFFVNSSTCSSKFSYITKCEDIMNDLDIINLGYITDIKDVFKNSSTNYSVGMIEFLEHLQTTRGENKIKYVVAEFKIEGEYYYAAIEVKGE